MTEKTILVKDEFIYTLIEEIEMMKYTNPKCDFEHISNQAYQDVIKMIETFYDENPNSREISINDKEEQDD